MPIRKQITRRLEIGMGTIEGPIVRVIAQLRDYEEQYGPGARLEIDYGYDTSDQLYLVFESPETGEEYDARMRERRKAKNEKAKRDQKAWNTFLKLKKRFDSRDLPEDEI